MCILLVDVHIIYKCIYVDSMSMPVTVLNIIVVATVVVFVTLILICTSSKPDRPRWFLGSSPPPAAPARRAGWPRVAGGTAPGAGPPKGAQVIGVCLGEPQYGIVYIILLIGAPVSENCITGLKLHM